MSVIFVILGFVLVSLVLVHINLHQKKKELYDFIYSVNKTLILRHKKIEKILSFIEDSDLVQEIKTMNQKVLSQLQSDELLPSQRVRLEVLIEDKMNLLLKTLIADQMSEKLVLAIESYKKTQKRVEKNKKIYNKMMQELMSACDIRPADLFASIEKIDMDFPKLSTQAE